MVKANSTETTDFVLIDHYCSTEPTERELYEKGVVAYTAIMERLQPILKFLLVEQGYNNNGHYIRFARVCEIETNYYVPGGGVVLTISGPAIIEKKDDGSEGVIQTRPDEDWKYMPFNRLLAGLHNMLVEAEERKRKHLEAVADRRRFVEGIMRSF